MPESISGWRWERHRSKDENDEWYDCPGCEKCLHDNPLFPPLHILRKSSWRHTRAHEYIFPLVKKRGYFCDQEAVRERFAESTLKDFEGGYGWNDGGKGQDLIKDGTRGSGGLCDPTKTRQELHNPSGRNPRSVLDVPTAPYKGQHFATFPPNLIAPLIRASVPRRCCPECGQAWAAVVERRNVIHKREPAHQPGNTPTKVDSTGWEPTTGNVTGYRPTCDCGREDHVPGIVLDIFAGSGTVPMVAHELGLRSVGMDISYPYLDEQARYRAKWGEQKTKIDDLPLFGGDPQPKIRKQDELGKHTYTGFNKRWSDKQGKQQINEEGN